MMSAASHSELFMNKAHAVHSSLPQFLQSARKSRIYRPVTVFCLLALCLGLALSVIMPSAASAEPERDRRNAGGLSTPEPQTLSVQFPDSIHSSVTLPLTVLIGLGDSLNHGTMDATNNVYSSWHGYIQRVSDSLGQVMPIYMRQPFFDLQEQRVFPFEGPTNLAVDGSDIFSIDGVEYYKRVGAPSSYTSKELLRDALSPGSFSSIYDKVLFPLNTWAKRPLTALDASIWLTNILPYVGVNDAILILWSGNNDSSLAALGAGGSKPTYPADPV